MRAQSVVVVATAALVCGTLVGGAGAGRTARASCGAKPDRHQKWEVVFGTESNRDAARRLQQRTLAKGFRTFIEVESCTAYEVSTARFPTRAVALVVYNRARTAGFARAHLEES